MTPCAMRPITKAMAGKPQAMIGATKSRPSRRSSTGRRLPVATVHAHITSVRQATAAPRICTAPATVLAVFR